MSLADAFNEFVRRANFPLQTNAIYTADVWEQRVGPSVNEPLGTFSQFTLYYPIDRYDQLDPVPVTYAPNGPVTPLQLLQTISGVYATPMTEENVSVYTQMDPSYDFLNEDLANGVQLKLVDAMGDLTNITELEPYENGYLLKLEP